MRNSVSSLLNILQVDPPTLALPRPANIEPPAMVLFDPNHALDGGVPEPADSPASPESVAPPSRRRANAGARARVVANVHDLPRADRRSGRLLGHAVREATRLPQGVPPQVARHAQYLPDLPPLDADGRRRWTKVRRWSRRRRRSRGRRGRRSRRSSLRRRATSGSRSSRRPRSDEERS